MSDQVVRARLEKRRDNGDSHPFATHYTAHFTDTLDYIFYNENYL
jgi:mRNA deadenylase 3'-5' endonuclease subunit Ccr4